MEIIKTQSYLGEGLSYFKKRKRIICFDILECRAYFIDPASNWEFTIVDLPFRGSCAFETADGKVVIAGDHGLYQTYDFRSFRQIAHHALAEDMRMNVAERILKVVFVFLYANERRPSRWRGLLF